MHRMELSAVAAELYALLPSEFIAARGARAKEAKASGDTELAARIGRLPKPTATAWAINLLARSGAPELEELLGLGAALREAQAGLRRGCGNSGSNAPACWLPPPGKPMNLPPGSGSG